MSEGKVTVSKFLDDYVQQPTIREQIVQRCADLLRHGHTVIFINGVTGEATKIHPFERYLVFDEHGRRVVGGDD